MYLLPPKEATGAEKRHDSPFLRDPVEAFNLKGAAKSLHTPSRRMKMNKNQVIEYLVTKIEDEEEPLFLLRARDTLASRAILAWCKHAKRFSVPQEKIESAQRVAVEMDMYLGPKRFPD